MDKLPWNYSAIPPEGVIKGWGTQQRSEAMKQLAIDQETENLESRLLELETLTLPEKGKEIKSVISESYRLARRSVIEAYYAGCLLRSVKSDLEHGNFRVWLENNEIKPRTAQNFMKLAQMEIRKVCVFDSVSAALKSLPKPQKAENPDTGVSTVKTLSIAEKRIMERDGLNPTGEGIRRASRRIRTGARGD